MKSTLEKKTKKTQQNKNKIKRTAEVPVKCCREIVIQQRLVSFEILLEI